MQLNWSRICIVRIVVLVIRKVLVNKVIGQVKQHNCGINWGGSSKAMESDLAVDMLLSGTTEKARVSTIIMDEDSITMKKQANLCHMR